MNTDTPRTDDCPFCGMKIYSLPCEGDETTYWMCGTDLVESFGYARSSECYEKELADYGTRAEREQKRAEKAEAEVERLTGILKSLRK